MPPNTRPPRDSDRIIKQEVVAETLKSDIRELKQKLDSLDDEVTDLAISQRVQLADLDNIKKSLGSLEATIKTMTSTVVQVEKQRELDNDINKHLSAFTMKKLQSYFAIGGIIAGIVWAIYGFMHQATKPDYHLQDFAQQQKQIADEAKK